MEDFYEFLEQGLIEDGNLSIYKSNDKKPYRTVDLYDIEGNYLFIPVSDGWCHLIMIDRSCNEYYDFFIPTDAYFSINKDFCFVFFWDKIYYFTETSSIKSIYDFYIFSIYLEEDGPENIEDLDSWIKRTNFSNHLARPYNSMSFWNYLRQYFAN